MVQNPIKKKAEAAAVAEGRAAYKASRHSRKNRILQSKAMPLLTKKYTS